MVRDLQSSGMIREHLKELNDSFYKSINKDLLDEHIVFWMNRLSLKVKQEKQLEEQLKQ
jgi:hypothetical protein|tara:strand:- start:541 stop:717 length:177 start_codon:yes stop_codon:yes gene_type:complete